MKSKKPSKYAWLEKSYNNLEFLNSPAARNIRMLSEMIEPETRFRKHRVKNTVVFFGSARTLSKFQATKNLNKLKKEIKTKTKPVASLKKKLLQAERDLIMSRYYEDASDLAEKLTVWFKSLKTTQKQFMVCSGGGPGIMEAANHGAAKAKGKSIGLNISLPMEQYPNKYQTQDVSFEFHYFFIRKFWFFYLAKALVVMPGGFGTMDEFFELLTLIQTQKSKKYMPIVLYGSEYWSKIINFDELVKWGGILPKDLKLFKIFDDPEKAFQYLKKEITKHHL